jgi:hypothetical protein
MTQQETDSLELLESIRRKRLSAYDQLRVLDKYNTEALSHCGYSSFDEATRDILKSTEKEINQAIKEFEKKHPEDAEH